MSLKLFKKRICFCSQRRKNKLMGLKNPEGVSEILGITLLFVCYALLLLVFLYLFRPYLFTPIISALEKYLQNMINFLNKT